MVIKVNVEKCTGCGACIPVCPVEAIVLSGVASVNTARCNACRLCLTVCPVKAITCR